MGELQFTDEWGIYSMELHLLSAKPQGYRLLSLCSVNGVDFVCESRDACLKTQNSGIMAMDPKSDLYGVLEAVIELIYANGMKVYLFKCRWFNSNLLGGTTKIDHGLISVNTARSFYENEPFILATHAIQVFLLVIPRQVMDGKS